MVNYDVCVIGGGPSGAAIAKRLAQCGYSIVIVEKEIFPREHVGISMSPGVHHWLDLLGVREEILDSKLTPATNTFLLWENNLPVTKENAGGFHVDRGIFDQILLNAAVVAGAHLIQPCGQIYLEEGREWKIGSSSFSITAKFIIEATGRRSILNGRKTAYLPPTLAAYAYWNTDIAASYIEAGENHWYWAAPAGNGKLMACIFSDPKNAKSRYFERLKDFSLLYPQLQNATCSNVSVCTATAYSNERPVSHNHIKIGDAAFSTDPLSAQGVQKALKTALQGAIVVNTIFSGNADVAIDFYNEMVRAEVKKNGQWTKQHYNNQNRYEGGEFWEKRKSKPIPLSAGTISIKETDKIFLNPAAALVNIPIISGIIIEQEQGIIIDDEPFVFLQGFSIIEITTALHNKNIVEAAHVIKSSFAGLDPLQVLEYLFYHKIMVKRLRA